MQRVGVGVGNMWHSHGRVAWVLALGVTVMACGDSEDAPGGEPCDSPGMTQFCRCAVSELGRQTCLDTGYWGDCNCPGSPSTACVPGGPSPCSGCPDEPAVCNDAGGYDCSCGSSGTIPDAGMSTPTDGGNPTDAGKDAGSDAGSDAASGDDGGSDDGG